MGTKKSEQKINEEHMRKAREAIANLKNPNCAEDDVFFQAMEEVLFSITPLYLSDPKYKKNAVVKRLIKPDRIIKFKVEWMDDNNQIQVNTGRRSKNTTL